MASIKNIAPNRAVAVLTPLVFAPLAGAISVAAADVAPGVNIDEGSLTAIFIAGATIAFGKAAQWTKGWQAFEQRGVVTGSAMDGGDDEHLLEDLTDVDDAELSEGDLDLVFDDDMDEGDDELESAFALEPEDDFDDEDDELIALASAHEE